jgi:hypothetical protein
MNFYKKGAEDTLRALGIQEPEVLEKTRNLVDEYTPEAVKDLQESLGQSYRATPYNVLFGRYKDTARGLLQSAKENVTGIFD